MVRQFVLFVLTGTLFCCHPSTECWARGRGGGGARAGGGFRGGGGFGGGARPSFGGFGGGAGPSLGGFGGGRMPNLGGFGGGGLGPGGLGAGGGLGPRGGGGLGPGGPGLGGLGGGSRAGGGLGGLAGRAGGGPGALGGRGMGGPGTGAADRFSSPSRNQLSNFLGLPSDGGLQSLGQRGAGAGPIGQGAASDSAGPRLAAGQAPAGGANPFEPLGGGGGSRAGQRGTSDNFDVNYGTKEGPRGGEAAGVAVTGPRGNTAGRAVGEGPRGGVGTVGGVKGADGGAAARGAAVGPNGRVAAGGAVRGPEGGAAARGVVAGPRGVAAGFARVTPSGRYTCAAAVRSNYNHWGIYGRGWYAAHPAAWYPVGWAAGAAWTACAWDTAAAYCGYADVPPVYYNYGTNVTYEDGNVYVDGQDYGTEEQYYDQAAEIATRGVDAGASPDEDWLPLGVFALTRPDHTQSVVTIQLAVNKQGIIRGNYTDTKTDKTQEIQGSVDKQTQRVVFAVGDNRTNYVETGLYNLTKDEAPVLIHFGKDRTEQWLLVRLEKPADSSDQQDSEES